VRSEDAVEIVRASLALAFPTASAEGLARAAETVIRWGSEDVVEHLDDPLTTRMLFDLMQVAGVPRADLRSAEPDWLSPDRLETRAHYRTWSRTEGMDPLPFLPRPPDEPTTPGRPDPPAPTTG
jgi:hypothetical protein